MAAESTPIRDGLKVNFPDVFDDLTPVGRNNSKRKKREDLYGGVKGGCGKSSDESDGEPVMKSQVLKKRKDKKHGSKLDKRMQITHDGHQNNSGDLIQEDENFYVNINSQLFDSNIKFLDSGIDKVLLNLNYDLNDGVDVISNGSKAFDSKLHKSVSKNESFKVTDVINSTDKSLMPQESEPYFSNLIKKKLLENASNKEVVKSQASGWTQYEFLEDSSFHIRDLERFFGLPLRVQQLYEEHKGIKELYSWQQECLKLGALKLRKNLVYTLPTSGGKSLVAEILILQEIILHKKNALLVLPFVSIVQEKIRDFSQFSLDLGFFLDEYAAGKGVIPPKKHRKRNSLLVATIEKALIVVNSLIETNRLDELGLVVVDELHLLSEEGRGSTLETLLIQIMHSGKHIQIVGMTATIGNLNEVAAFLDAESYSGNFRPVKLTEYLKCGNKIYSIDSSSEELIEEKKTVCNEREEDTDGIGSLVEEVIPSDSVLIFCPTKKNCENIASLLSRLLPTKLKEHKKNEKASLYRALVSETNDQICPTLKKTIPFGVAYHHSGLTAGERKLLEEAFRQGTLSVICCTSTLAAGVNLPAKRVILRSPYVGKDFISLSRYKQMVGRAGRTGFGSEGESYLICQTADLEKVNQLFCSRMDEAVSKLNPETCKDLVLSAIGLGTATTRRQLKELLKHSLLHHQRGKLKVDTEKMVDECVQSLFSQGAVGIKNLMPQLQKESASSVLELNSRDTNRCVKVGDDSELVISRLGRAAMKGGLSLEIAHQVYDELVRAQASLVLLTNLHLLYLVTPYDLTSQIRPNFSILFNIYMQFTAKELQTAGVIGITEYVVSKLAVGVQPKTIKESVLSRFYICLILNELWNQRTIWDVSVLFQLPRGIVQTVMTSAATFANSVLRFCEELKEFWSFKSLLTDFAPRLAHCCAPELLPLMDLPAVKRGRAKQLYDAGFKTLETLAVAKPAELVRAIDHMPHKIASQIVAAAKMLLTEKAESLKEEAETVFESLGLRIEDTQ